MSPRADRPEAPASYGIGRDGSAAGAHLPWTEIERWLVEARNYWVVTVRPDGRPHAMPVWGLWIDGALCFSTDPESRKGQNIAVSPEVVVHLESGDDVAVLEGRAEPLTDSGTLSQFIDAYEDKYGFRIEAGEPTMGVYAVRPRVAFGWREADYADSATRWHFDAEI
jgi:hypothetical protein